MPNKMSTKSRSSAALVLSIAQGDIQSSDEKIRTGFLQCSIEEEDCLDDIEPILTSIALTESFSSHVSSDGRSLGECFEVTPDQCSASDFIHRRLQTGNELKNFSEPSSARIFLTSNINAEPVTADLFDDALCRYGTKSLSMHDVSKIPTFPLVSKRNNLSSETIQSQSITTVGSLPKSKDSGFPRSVSCLSLNSGKSYDHIQSKVKEHIKQVKTINKTKRKLTYESVKHETTKCKVDVNCEDSTSPQTLVQLIIKLKDELEEKDRMLLKLQENYDTLLVKYAAAENRIDHLRINSVGNSFDIAISDYKKPKASPNVLLLPNLYGLQKTISRLIDKPAEEKFKEVKPSNQSNLTESVTNKFQSTSFCNRISESSEVTTRRVVKNQFTCNYKPVCVASKNEKFRSIQHNYNMNSQSYQVDNEPDKSYESQSKIEISVTRDKPNDELSARTLNCQLENPFVKVKRWQESLPSLHLIEPSTYGHFTCNEAESNLLNQNLEKDKLDVLPCKLDNGCTSQIAPVIEGNNSSTTRLTEKRQFSTPSNKTDCEMTDDRNDALIPEPSILNSSLNKVATDVFALKNCDIPDHSSKSKDIAMNFHSVSSTNSCSTYHCPEVGSDTDVNLPSYIDENRCKESAKIPEQSGLNVAHPQTTFTTQTKSKLPCIPMTNDCCQPCLCPVVRLSCLNPCSYEGQSSVENTDTSGSVLLLNTTKDIGETNLCLNDSNNLCNCITKGNTQVVTCGCSEPGCERNNGTSYCNSFEEKNTSLIQFLDEMNQFAQKLRGKSEAIMQVLSTQLKEL